MHRHTYTCILAHKINKSNTSNRSNRSKRSNTHAHRLTPRLGIPAEVPKDPNLILAMELVIVAWLLALMVHAIRGACIRLWLLEPAANNKNQIDTTANDKDEIQSAANDKHQLNSNASDELQFRESCCTRLVHSMRGACWRLWSIQPAANQDQRHKVPLQKAALQKAAGDGATKKGSVSFVAAPGGKRNSISSQHTLSKEGDSRDALPKPWMRYTLYHSHTHTHAYTHAYTHARTHTHIHTHTHTHTHK
jgi:hypothetical protein